MTKPTARVQTIPGSFDSKTVTVELEPEDACKVCGAYPTHGLWLTCFSCWQPVCDRCAVQWADGHFCPTCAPKVNP